MSLINQALKKAQRDRSGEPTPPTPAGASPSGISAHQMATRQKSIKPGLIIGVGVAFAVLIGLVVGLTVVLVNSGDTPAEIETVSKPIQSAPQATAPQAKPLAEPAAPTAQKSPAIAAAPVAQKPTPATDEPDDTMEELRLAREAAEAKVRAEAEAARKAEEAEQAAELAARKAAEEAAAKAKAAPNPAIITWLEEATITGVRLSETGNKVLLNGRSFGVGEHVNYKLNLKVMAIRDKLVLFVDENGKKYLKRL